jgi:hypothetical protein
MATSIGLIVMVALFAVGGVLLVRASRRKMLGRGQSILALGLGGLVILFLVWMAIMVLVVGPAMRTI